jgi:hypothetical protein
MSHERMLGCLGRNHTRDRHGLRRSSSSQALLRTFGDGTGVLSRILPWQIGRFLARTSDSNAGIKGNRCKAYYTILQVHQQTPRCQPPSSPVSPTSRKCIQRPLAFYRIICKSLIKSRILLKRVCFFIISSVITV